jgi:hypothetical protein
VSGDLTPECAAVVAKVLDALSAPGGEEDDRSQAQRYHDALQEAMQRLVTADLVPERAACVCQVHHVKHKKNGGETSITECVLLCRLHHLIVIHRWDWSLVLNRDGTTTAWNKDRTKVLHSHGPPVRPG